MTPVSAVATLLDEAASVEVFLRTLLAQTRPPDEIVVVDGGSADGTLEALRAAAESEPRLRVEVRPGASISEGRNAAIAAARGPIIAVADAGTEISATWLEHLVRPLEADEEVGVSAGFFAAGGETWFERVLATLITPQLEEIDPATFLPSSRSVAFRKAWWERVGGYPEWLEHCEDLVFDLDLRRAGARFAFAPEATVTWRGRPDLRRFYRQYYLYARGDGHALLWSKRHAARYAAYAGGSALLAAAVRRPAALAVLGAGVALHLRQPARRLARRPVAGTPVQRLAAWALVPVVTVTGDVAKMHGYPVGRRERARRAGRLADLDRSTA